MKIKTNELKGHALDWAVAKCNDFDTRNNYRCQVIDADDIEHSFVCYAENDEHAEEQAQDAYPDSDVQEIEYLGMYNPSTEWAHGGPIIARERITLYPNDPVEPKATITPNLNKPHYYFRQYGPTALIAAMRCFVASKLGDEVEIPEELL